MKITGIKGMVDMLKGTKTKEVREPEYFDDLFFEKLKDFFSDKREVAKTGRTTLISEILLDLALMSEYNKINLLDHITPTYWHYKHYQMIFNRIVELTQYLRVKYDVKVELMWSREHPIYFSARFYSWEDRQKYSELKGTKKRLFNREFFENL